MKPFSHLRLRVSPLSRRMFLGAVGAGISIPLLPSLVPQGMAQEVDYGRVIFVVWEHGLFQDFWYPTGVTTRDVAPNVRAGSLAGASMGLYLGSAFDDLRAKISILRGVSQIGAWSHPTALALTASEFFPDRVDGDPIVGTYPSSIDNVLADSGRIYSSSPSLDVLRLAVAGGESHSIRRRSPVNPLESAEVAFDLLFPGGVMPPDPMAPVGPDPAQARTRRRALLVDQVLGDYTALRGDRRISAGDRRLLDQTMEHYRDLQAGLMRDGMGPMVDPRLCAPFSVDGSEGARVADHVRLFTQGFACNATRLGYWRLESSHADEDGAHQASSSRNESVTGLYSAIMRRNCENVAALLRSMDAVEEANGKTLLENSLVVFTSDLASSIYGSGGHTGIDAPFLIGGGLDGRFRMGELIDYSDYGAGGLLNDDYGYALRGGPPHNELMMSILHAFDVPPSAYEDGGPGFGSYECGHAALCDGIGQEHVTQQAYTEYYRTVHRARRAPGAELPYWRVASTA